MSACAHKRTISQVLCAVVLILVFCFGALPGIQAGAVTPPPLRIVFQIGTGSSPGYSFTPDLADLENFHVEGGTVYLSGKHYNDPNSIVPANKDSNLNQRAAELSESLPQGLPLNAILIDFDEPFEKTLIGTTLTNHDLLAYQPNKGIAYVTSDLHQESPGVFELSQLFSHVEIDQVNENELILYYTVDLNQLSGTEPSEPAETEDPEEGSGGEETDADETEIDVIDDDTEESEETSNEAETEVSEVAPEESPEETETTEESEITEEPETEVPRQVEEEPEIDDSGEADTDQPDDVTEDTVPEDIEDATEETAAEEATADEAADESTSKPEDVADHDDPIEKDSKDDIITVVWKTSEEIALEHVKDGLDNLVKPQTVNTPEEGADEEAPAEAVNEEPHEEDAKDNRDVVVLLANPPTDDPLSEDSAEEETPTEEPDVAAPVTEEPATEEVSEPTTTPADPAMEKAPEETEPQVKLQAPADVTTTKIDQRFKVLEEATTILENYLPTLPEKNAFAARMQQRRIEELITELRDQTATNEHKAILQNAENVLNQSKLKLEIKSTVVLIGATGESLFYSIIIGSTLLTLGAGLIILRRRRKFT